MSELPSIPQPQQEDLVFNPDREFLPGNSMRRAENFRDCFKDITLGKHNAAKQGYEAAKAFIRYVEPYLLVDKKDTHLRNIETVITEFDELVAKTDVLWKQICQKEGISSESWAIYLSGWKAEVATAMYFFDAGYDVDLATSQQDLREKTDFVVTDLDDNDYRIQTKTLALDMAEFELEERDMSIPIMNPLRTLGDLNTFLGHIAKLGKTEDIFFELDGDHFEYPLTEDNISAIIERSIYKVYATIEPKEGLMHGPNSYGDSNKLCSLIEEAIMMHLLLKDNDETPVLMLMGSPYAASSDIDPKKCTLRPRSQEKADIEMEIIKESLKTRIAA